MSGSAARLAQLRRWNRSRSQTVGSSENVYINSKYSGRFLLADCDEIKKIVADFTAIENKYALFERMFIQLFVEEEVELAVHFGLAGLSEEQLRKEQRFRTHVGKFQRFMTSIVALLASGPNKADHIVDILRIVGRQHCNVRSMSFTAEKWLIFKNVLLSLLCRENQDSYSTWSKLISFIIFEIKDAYLEHVRRARSSSCPHVPEARLMWRNRQFSADVGH